MSQPYPVPIPLPQPKSRPLPDSRGIPDTLNLFFFGKHMQIFAWNSNSNELKLNLPWKQSIDKNRFFSEVVWMNPCNEICLWYWFAGLKPFDITWNNWLETKRFGLFFIVKCVTKSSGEQLKVLTPYFLCLHISEIPVTIKGRISYNNESNQKSWLHTFLSSHVLMKTQCEPKIMLIKTQTLKCLCLHVFQFQKFLSKKAEFLITMRAIKSLDFFVFTCAHEDSFWTKNNVNVCVFMSFQFQRFLSKKAEFIITMRATKSFDTILFVSSCLQISEIPVTIKGRIFLSHWIVIKSLDFFVFTCAHEDSLWTKNKCLVCF